MLLLATILAISQVLSACGPTISPPPPLPRGSKEPVAFLGISFQGTTDLPQMPAVDQQRGLTIIRVLWDSPAQHAGLKVGDIIVEYDAKSFPDRPAEALPQLFREYIATSKRPGDTLRLKILRPVSRFSGKRNGDAIEIEDPAGLEELLRGQGLVESLDVSIERTVNVRKVVARLSERAGRGTASRPAQRPPAVHFGDVAEPYVDLPLRVLDDFQLAGAYAGLVARFREEALWDDGYLLTVLRAALERPLEFPAAVDRRLGGLRESVLAVDVASLIRGSAELLDTPVSPGDRIPAPPDGAAPEGHLDFLAAVIDAALAEHERAFRHLSRTEMRFLSSHLGDLMDHVSSYYDIGAADDPRTTQSDLEVIRLGHSIDYAALLRSAEILTQLADSAWLAALRASLSGLTPQPDGAPGLKGTVLLVRATSAGPMIIGGPGPNSYGTDAAVIVDAGGNDFYSGRAGSADPTHPLSVVIDLAGDDQYSSTTNGSLGSGQLGVGLLLDVEGNDEYTGMGLAQGSGTMGVGMLIDLAGDDDYFAHQLSQGVAFWGLGMLLDRQGNDRYRADRYAQGVGGPQGLGALWDGAGNDQYDAGGREPSSYGTPGIFDGFAQGLGIGLRDYASGGVGILLDTGGKDRYRAGNFSQGCGYALGLGILNDFGPEGDVYVGSRYGQGAAAHSAAGILIDEGGDDRYGGRMGALQAAAWDLSVAALIDRAGDDRYDAGHRFFSQAAAAHNGFSLFADLSGTDTYIFPPEPKIGSNTYHGGWSLSIFIDGGGATDSYNGRTDHNNRIRLDGEYGLMVDLDTDLKDALRNGSYRRLYPAE